MAWKVKQVIKRMIAPQGGSSSQAVQTDAHLTDQEFIEKYQRPVQNIYARKNNAI